MNKLTLFLFLIFTALPQIQLHAQTGLQIITPCQDSVICLPANECSSINFSTSVIAITDCSSTNIDFSFQIDWDDDGTIDLTGNTSIINSDFPKGTHRIIFAASDLCGQLDSCEIIVQIKDCEAPTISCVADTISVFMPGSGIVHIPATDLVDSSSVDNCTNFEDLIFTFSTDINDTIQVIYIPIIPCDAIYEFNIFVHDGDGNLDSCLAYVHVFDIHNNSSSIIVSSTPNLFPLLNVEYSIHPTSGNSYIGMHPFCDFNQGDTIIPIEDSPPLNGVTTFDIVLIRKHILGIDVFDSPYKEIAADVNKSGTITALDIVIIRSLILHITDEFPSGESWIFEPAYITDFNFLVFMNLYDFTGIKLGDVNYTATNNWLQNSPTETRTDGTLDFYAKNQNIEQGKTYTIPTFSKDFKNILGMQFTIDFDTDALAFQNIQPHNLTNFSNENFGFNQIENGHILCSWSNVIPQNLESDQTIYNITFTAKQDGRLSDFLNINSSQIRSEAYIENKDGFDFKSIELNFEDATSISSDVSIFPNPFSEKTTLTFSLEKEQSVSIQIFDINGRLIISQQSTGSVGENQFEILQADLPISGIYFYRINSENRILTGRLVLK